jgi:sarcosine oxidase subunit beta
MEGNEARRRFSYLSPAVMAARFRQGDGWLNPRRLALGLLRASGADLRCGDAVDGLLMEGGGVAGVRTSAGEISCGAVVIAAGPLSGALGSMAGVQLPLVTVRRQRLVVPDLDLVPPDAPMTIDSETGAHWRPGLSGAFALHTAPAPEEPPMEEVPPSSEFAFGLLDPESDHALARVSPFWASAWESGRIDWFVQAGQYDYTPDHRPLLGPLPLPGLFINTGYSGHGIMGSIGGSRRLVDTIIGRLAPESNPFRPDRQMIQRTFDVL